MRNDRSGRAFVFGRARFFTHNGRRFEDATDGAKRFARGLTRKRESESGDGDADGDFEQELRIVERKAVSDTWWRQRSLGSSRADGRGEKKSGKIRFATDGVDVALVAYLLLIVVGGWRADFERSGAGHHLVASNGRGAGHHQRRGTAWSRARDARRMASGSRTSNERKLRASRAAHRAAACGKRARDGVDSREDDGRHGRSMRWSRSDPPPAKPRRRSEAAA